MEKYFIGGFLKEFRKVMRLSQQSLADKIGTSSGYISDLEGNKKTPGGDFLYTLKLAYPSIDMNYVLAIESIRNAEIPMGQGVMIEMDGIMSWRNKILNNEDTNDSPVSDVNEVYDWQAEQERVRGIENENIVLKAKVEVLQETLIKISVGIGPNAAQVPTQEPKPDKYTVIGRFGGKKKKDKVTDQE